MKLVGLMLTRNSDWVIGLSLRAMLMFCDSVVVLCHRCTDRTIDIAIEIGKQENRVIVVGDDKPEWEEMRLRQAMLELARADGATHIWLGDDDEMLTGDLLPSIRDLVKATPEGKILQLPMLCPRDGINQIITTGLWSESQVCVAFQDASHWHWQASGAENYDFHHRHPMGRAFAGYTPINYRYSGVMHLQFASMRRLLAKQALYQATERLRWPGRKMGADYKRTVNECQTARTSPASQSWWQPYAHLMQYLHIDAEPWQELELKRLVAEHGRDKFRGLDFFGVA